MRSQKGWSREILLLWVALIFLLGSAAGCLTPKRVKASKRCVDCHEDKRQAFLVKKEIHAPVREGQCEGCHYPHGLIGGSLLKEQGKLLCYSCHPKEAIEGGGHLHSALKSEEKACVACHAPHASQEKGLLVKGGERAVPLLS